MVFELLSAAGVCQPTPQTSAATGTYGPVRSSGGKRDRLRNADHVPFKCMSLSGPSRIDDIDLKTLHGLVSQGDQWVEFFSDLYSPDLARRAIHISRVCGLLIAFSEKMLACPVANGIVAAGVMSKLKAEHSRLKDAWAVLHVKQAAGQNNSLRYATAAQKRTRDEVESAVHTVYEHMVGGESDKSTLRLLAQFMSMGGVTYVTHTMDKVLRAYLLFGKDGGPVSEQDMVEICVKRFVLGHGGEAGPAEESSMMTLASLGGS